MQIPGNSNIFLLPGHIGLAEYETTLGIAQELSGSLLALRNMPGSIRFLLDATAVKYAAEYVLVDMSPSLGPLNQNLLMTGDHFVVPLHPDYFSSMALTSLAKTLPRWKSWAKTAHSIEVLRDADYPFPEPKATFIGAIIQKYHPWSGKASKAFQHWIDQLIDGLKRELVPNLEKAELLTTSLRRCRDRLVVRLWWRIWTGRILTAVRAGNAVRYGAQAAAGYNFRRLLAWLRFLLLRILIAFSLPAQLKSV